MAEGSHVYNSLKLPQTHGFYGAGNDVWTAWAKKIGNKIPEGVVLYGEIVGYLPSGRMIQKGYDYGCPTGENDFYLYRATFTNPEGITFELTSAQTVKLAAEIGIKHVPIINKFYIPGTMVHEYFLDMWDKFVNDPARNQCKYNQNKVPAEGIVVKIEGLHQSRALKHKSFAFKQYETKQLDEGQQEVE